MRRSNFVIKLMSAVVILAIVSYIGFYALHALLNPFKTIPAVKYPVEESGEASGFVVRTETVLHGGGSTVFVTAEDGSSIAVNQQVAVDYKNTTALERATQIHALEIQISQLEAAQSASSSSIKTADIYDGVLGITAAVSHKDFSGLDALSVKLQSLIFSDSSSAPSDGGAAQLTSLKSQLSTLQKQSGSDTTAVKAAVSGLFSSSVDGYEGIVPDNLTGLTPTKLTALFQTPKAKDGTEIGKLITDMNWYFAAVMSTADASRLTAGKSAQLRFRQNYNGTLKMTVVSIGDDSGGKCVVVFSCSSAMADIAAKRSLTADVIFDSYVGIRVPEEAVHLDKDGKSSVYVLMGVQSELIHVKILHKQGDYYIVEDDVNSSNALRVGAEIIVKGNDLFDGKVVQ